MARLERKYLAHFIEIPGDLGSIYVRLGKDLESYEEELNPKVSVQRNLGGEPNVVISGYEAESKVEQYYADPSEAIFYFVQNIANKRLTDDTCKTHKVDALFDETGAQIWAYREDCYVVPTSIGGDTSGVQIPFSIYCGGNRIYGTFNLETKTFEGGGEEPPSGAGIVPLNVVTNGVYSAGEGMAYNPVTVNVDINVAPDLYAEKRLIERDFPSVYSNSLVGVVGETAFAFASTLQSVRLENCRGVSDMAFMSCLSLQSVYMPSCSGDIAKNTFMSCLRLSDLTLDFSRVSAIRSSAFQYCWSLTSVSFPGCSLIDDGAFQSCGRLVSAYFSSCERIGSSAFQTDIRLSDISFPQCTFVFGRAFNSCYSLENVSFPELLSLQESAFYNCSSLTSVHMPKLEYVGQNVFAFTAISSLYLSQVNSMSWSAFALMKSLEYAELPNLSVLGQSAFRSCSKLSTLKLSVCGAIYSNVFYSCQSLTSLYLYSTNVCSLYGAAAFYYTPMSDSSYTGSWGSIYVPSSLVASYKAATNWNIYSDRITSIV